VTGTFQARRQAARIACVSGSPTVRTSRSRASRSPAAAKCSASASALLG
jgi:hypothetical protein